MEVILLEKVGKLGTIGDKVAVKAGYGRNFLVPQGKAIPATASNVAEFESRRIELEASANDKKVAASARATLLNEVQVIITATAGDEGKLFGSVGTRDIAEAITAAGVKVTKAEVRLPEGALREVGEYEIDIHLHSDITQAVNVKIEAA